MAKETLTEIDPTDVYFTFARIRPQFSCGRKVQDTLEAIENGQLKPSDLPPISVLYDPQSNLYFSLNNRRLYVFKELKKRGLIDKVSVRVKLVPDTKRMRDKYTSEKCSKTARLMPQRALEESS